ncbi:hypothetical protein OIU74_004184 [Salix koriyanagi]|uniref:Uncharacterized protein n=1 Tax=Salix koriyanagi TaxID=2511006 RepID=A0A9Q0ZLT7_9ROSI|nr:hypothetical protein OIU74_004184 [Salix koriyanagi]
MPKVRRSRIKYPEGWELIEPTLRELDGKMREAELDPHDGKRKCEALWPIFKITHQKSRYIYDLYYRRNEISKELYEFCLDQGYGDRNLIAKVEEGFQNISGKRRLLSVCIVVVEAVQVVIDCYFVSFLCDSLPASLKPSYDPHEQAMYVKCYLFTDKLKLIETGSCEEYGKEHLMWNKWLVENGELYRALVENPRHRVRFGCVIEAKAGELANEPTKIQKLGLYFLAKTPEFGKQNLTATLSFRNFGTLQSSEPFEFLKIQDNVGSWLLNLLNIKSMWA